jgi:hypothetical protein
MSHLQNEPPPSKEREPFAAGNVTITAIASISEIDGAAWDACANPPVAFDVRGTSDPAPAEAPHGSCHAAGAAAHLADRDLAFNPVLSHLLSAETSKSVGGRTGWQPQHLLVQAADGTLSPPRVLPQATRAVNTCSMPAGGEACPPAAATTRSSRSRYP